MYSSLGKLSLSRGHKEPDVRPKVTKTADMSKMISSEEAELSNEDPLTEEAKSRKRRLAHS